MLNWLLKQANVSDVFLEHRGELTTHVKYPLVLYIGLPIVFVLGIGIFLLQRRNLKSSPTSLIAALTACRVFILALLVVVLAGPFVKLGRPARTSPCSRSSSIARRAWT